MTITVEDAAYTAGIVDGEGYISARMQTKYYGEAYVGLNVSVSNTNLDLITWIKSKFGGRVTSRTYERQNWKTSYLWTISSKEEVVQFLKIISPYLKVKSEHCRLVLILADSISNHIPGSIDESEKLRRHLIVSKISDLNRRGREEKSDASV